MDHSKEPAGALDPFASFEGELDRLIAFQRRKVSGEGERINPRLTSDDLLMASDFPELAADPRFNYEDGILTGLLEARTLARRISQEREL